MFPICLVISWKLSKSKYAVYGILLAIGLIFGSLMTIIFIDEKYIMGDPINVVTISLAIIAITSITTLSLTITISFFRALYDICVFIVRYFLKHKPGNTQIEISFTKSKR